MSAGSLKRRAEPKTGELRAWRSFVYVLFPAHLIAISLNGPLRVDYITAAAVMLGLVTWGRRGRRISVMLFPFWLTAVAYENFGLFEPLRGDIHVGDIYALELQLFGVEVDGVVMPIAQALQAHTHAVFDLICGLAYIAYLWVPMVVAIVLYRRDRGLANRIALGFLIANLLGMATYLIYPAAPPWYVEIYGTGPAVLDAVATPAGALRFDELVGVSFFQNWYAHSTNVFGAMPSLHVAYPTAVFVACLRLGKRWSVPLGLFAVLVAVSALYLDHHYVLDVLAGAVYGCVAHALAVGVTRLPGTQHIWGVGPPARAPTPSTEVRAETVRSA